MPRESQSARQARARKIIAALKQEFPAVQCALNHRTPLQLLISTILSAQCTDVRVNMVTPALFKRYRGAKAFGEADQAELEELIRTTGFFRNKARNIKACCADLVAKHGGKVPRSLDELVQLAGIGRKTANVVLGTAYGIESGVVVDTHVQRISRLLGLTRNDDPVKIEQDLMALLPRDEWINFSHRLIWHGRQTCIARRPQCDACRLRKLCPSAFKARPQKKKKRSR
jgi:endonuclease-3